MNEATENEPTSTDAPTKKSFFNIFKKNKRIEETKLWISALKLIL